MSTPTDERFPYASLARQGARLERRLQPGSLPRLELVATAVGPAQVDMVFREDDDGRAWVRGHVDQRVRALCRRCLEHVEYELDLSFDLCVVRDDEDASRLAQVADVVAVEADTLTIAEVVEDELLLALPERLCRTEPCPRAPALSYPPDGADAAGADAPRTSPFSVLATLDRADS